MEEVSLVGVAILPGRNPGKSGSTQNWTRADWLRAKFVPAGGDEVVPMKRVLRAVGLLKPVLPSLDEPYFVLARAYLVMGGHYCPSWRCPRSLLTLVKMATPDAGPQSVGTCPRCQSRYRLTS